MDRPTNVSDQSAVVDPAGVVLLCQTLTRHTGLANPAVHLTPGGTVARRDSVPLRNHVQSLDDGNDATYNTLLKPPVPIRGARSFLGRAAVVDQ